VVRVTSDSDVISGSEPVEFLGRSLFQLVETSGLPGLMWALAQSIATGKGVALHVRLDPAVGRSQLCQMLLLPTDPSPSVVFTFVAEHSESSPDSDIGAPPDGAHGFDLSAVSRGILGLAEQEVPGVSELFSRELDVVTRLLAGHLVPAIANALYISQSTVRSQLSSVFKKLGVESQQELIDLLVLRMDATSREE
jgi:DNA-binding CsgD family transcriptional regulator